MKTSTGRKPRWPVLALVLQLAAGAIAAESNGPVTLTLEGQSTATAAFWLAGSSRRVFPASQPGAARLSLVVPRGGTVSFQAAFRNLGLMPLQVECRLRGADELQPRVRLVGLVPLPHLTTDTAFEELEGAAEGHIPGLVPDPLWPTNRVQIGPAESRSFWITLTVPPGVKPGPLPLTVQLGLPGLKRQVDLPVTLNVSELVLQPRRNFPIIHWWRGEATWDYYQTGMFDERWYRITRAQLEDMLAHGSDVVYVPMFFDRRETFKRPCQLLIVTEPQPGKYEFDWSEVRKFVAMCREIGFQQFEWSHLWIYWGVENPVRIYTKKSGEYVMLWPPDISGFSDTFLNFLKQFLPEFHAFLAKEGLLEHSYFHLSDEPGGGQHLANYKRARQILREQAPWMKVMDALSDIQYGRQGLTDIPIPIVSAAQAYIDEKIPHWVYYCCAPHGPWLNRFMDTPLAKIRMSGLLFYRLGAKGFLHWGFNYWHLMEREAIGDPFQDASNGLWPEIPFGDPFMIYPGPDGQPLDSIRWEVFAEALQDYAILQSAGVKPEDPMLQEIHSYAAFPKDESWHLQTMEKILRRAKPSLTTKSASSARTGSQAAVVTGEVVDEANGKAIPSRVYIRSDAGRWYFPNSAAAAGSAIRYERQNWLNTNSVEYHTTLSDHPFQVELPPGRYTLTVERGKEYRPLVQRVEIGADPVSLRLPLHRWVDMAARGWYSGDTHVHRTPDELPNLLLAEDLNVAFPLTYWVTKGMAPPTQGDKNTAEGASGKLVQVDATHVYWPRNTEYEIFTIGAKRHTLGAVFALGHQTPFTNGAPPVAPIAEQARREGALLDLDKHDWPWSMALAPLLGVDLYELANNHHWRTEFAMTNWSTAAPAWMGLPNQGRSGSDRDWTLYTFQNYYALLDCGYRLRPTAGTANGVHPVPLGYGRVYVHLPGGFSYENWLKGLNQGDSFITTGPMLLAEIKPDEVSGLVLSEEPVSEVELIINGEVRHRLNLASAKNSGGAWEAKFHQRLQLTGTSWVALRCFEHRGQGALRFAHTAPRWFDVPGVPLRPRQQEVEFLMQRVRDEITRSRAVLVAAAIAEYQRALAAYESRLALLAEPRPPANQAELRYWLENMTVFHRFTPEEVNAATGLSPAEISTALREFGWEGKSAPLRAPGEPLRVLPYPGGRHPRAGFFEGAILPQRETKFSVFTPWADGGYVVADVPEAILSNLGLIYLAHTHIPTLWEQQGLKLPRLEWNRHPDGSLDCERALPNGIVFGARVAPVSDAVRMELWLRNGTPAKLTGLRVQNCVMLKSARGFAAQSLTNKLFQAPYAAVRSEDGRRWIITAWAPGDRCWGNEQVPCLHADPKFPDCPAGETVRLRGWLSFYEGNDIGAELKRVEALRWYQQ